ncbi:MAG: flagellar basal body P-ring formation protein FlgA [Planctomycetaceae bacterium]|nr:flagellar basal body P-ring formation protein FlgA [Planctomycetaceae bacterium]
MNSQSNTQRRPAWPITTTALAVLMAVSGTVSASDLMVVLRDSAEVNDKVVRLMDIADVRGRNVRNVMEAKKLEICELEEIDGEATIDADFIQIFLQLRQLTTDENVVMGSSECFVRRTQRPALTDAEIEKAAARAMAIHLNVEPDNLRVALVSTFVLPLPQDVREAHGLTVDVVPPAQMHLGNVNLAVRLWKDGKMVANRNAPFQVLQRFHVVVTRRSMDRSTVVSAADVQEENRFMTSVPDEMTRDDIVGMEMVTPVKSGQILSWRELRTPVSLQKPDPVLIRNRDQVTVVARTGLIQVRLTEAQAMENGHLGDVIRWRNPSSNRISTGRVVAAGYLEVSPQ